MVEIVFRILRYFTHALLVIIFISFIDQGSSQDILVDGVLLRLSHEQSHPISILDISHLVRMLPI
jgi:hypothetical protein